MSRSIFGCALLTVALIACPRGAYAQRELKPPADCSLAPIRPVADLACRFSDDNIVQGREIELIVTITSDPTREKYELTDVVQVFPEPPSGNRDAHGIRQLGRPRPRPETIDPVSHRPVREYLVALKIDPEASPRPHDLRLEFVANNRAPEARLIRLYVGASDDKQERFVEASAEPAAPGITAGEDSTLDLRISNRFPSYRLKLERIEISSEPGGLIDTIKQARSEEIPAGSSRTIQLTVHGRYSFLRHVWPVESRPKLNVLIVYDDGYREGLERRPQIKFDFTMVVSQALNILLAVASILVGGLLGAWLRIRFTKTSRSERKVPIAERVAASLVLGFVIVVLMVAAQIEVLSEAASLRVALHKPIATAIISFLVALYDPTDLVQWLRDWAQRKPQTQPPVVMSGKP